ncbi:MAG: CPBP family intramembrane metalloprotease [Clostridia bacterium]|nr:CPBP family intramembrane metalloprotease [Clostridia bacterium]
MDYNNPYQQGGYNQYPPVTYYGNYVQPGTPYIDPFFEHRQEKKSIKRLSCVAGLCVLGYIVIQNILGMIIGFMPQLRDLYLNNPEFQSTLGILFSLFGVLLPFAAGAAFLRSRGVSTVSDCLEMPKDKGDFVCLVLAGFMLCIVANYLSMMLTDLIESVGFSLEDVEYPTPTSSTGWVIYFIEIAVVPPLCEEFAMRGVVMQPLRKYGETFAILMSAMVFAAMHGNLTQVPFAFLAGAVIGYAVCKTNSLWTGMAIHFLNNGFSVATELLTEKVSDVFTQNVVFYFSLGLIASTGICALVIYIRKQRARAKPAKAHTKLSAGKKTSAYVFTIPMLLSLISMIVITAEYVSWTGGQIK